MNEIIETILSKETFAVVGASTNTDKFGYKVWRTLREHGKTAYAVNPNATEIDSETIYSTLADLPTVPDVVVSVVPPTATETLPAQMSAQSIGYLWIQPGAESAKAVADAEVAGIKTVFGGACIMVELRRG
ncbi:MAG: CoA-binding protein [Armatimonadetes bacterium]|nr:CoA-binding protein [Armatimonadota bacterium]